MAKIKIDAYSLLKKIREEKPIVHHLTNWVTIYDCANIAKMLGASPVMAHAREEAAEMAAISSSLVLNIGTLTPDFVEAMKIAAKSAPAITLMKSAINKGTEIDIESETLDERGMVMDFSDVKRIIKEWIDEFIDHKMLLRNDDPMLPVLMENREPVYVMDVNPTAENIAKLIYDYALSQNLPVAEVRLWETESSFATYRGKK